MNPDSGKLHEVNEQTKKLLGRVTQNKGESAGDHLKRAVADWKRRADGEPPPGSPLPANWKLLGEGVELKPMRGLRFVVKSVDVEQQTITVSVVPRR